MAGSRLVVVLSIALLIAFLPGLSVASGFTIISSERSVYTELTDRLNGSFDPSGQTIVVSDSLSGLGTFDESAVNHRTTLDQQSFTTATATQLSSIGANSITVFLDVDFDYEPPGTGSGPWFGGFARSTLDITFSVAEEMQFDLSGVFGQGGFSGSGAASFELRNLDGTAFSFSGTISGAHDICWPPECPDGVLSFSDSDDHFGFDNNTFSGGSIN